MVQEVADKLKDMSINKEIPADKLEYVVYSNDPALEHSMPDFSTLKYFTQKDGEGVPTEFQYDSTSTIPLIITFTNKLNVADFKYLGDLENYSKDEKLGSPSVLAIARDPNEKEVKSFCRKYVNQEKDFTQHNFKLFFNFPVAFDEGSKVNSEFKKIMQKAVCGVGVTFIIVEGKIKWYEYFVRGESVMNQFEEQLKRIAEGKELLSNGLAPEIEDEEEEELEGGNIPVDADPFGGNDNY
eukprot:maker-scaffold_1-snap-gene-23.25-mRNA-1 protein AED:0.01 eAED:0.01 QI:399/1/1/1/1/1/3/104/239